VAGGVATEAILFFDQDGREFGVVCEFECTKNNLHWG